MKMQPTDLTPKTPNETVTVQFSLIPALSGATIVSAVWSSDPAGLTFSSDSIIESNTGLQVNVSAGDSATVYVIKALCTLSTGGPVEPWARILVKTAGLE